MHVAVVLEQCWHRVPGGTARAALEQVRAVSAVAAAGVEQVGVSARHREPPSEPWRPVVPVHPLPLPRRMLYEAWHRFNAPWPRVESAVDPVDVIHATGYAIPPRSRPLVVTLHDLAWRRDPSHFTRHGVRFFDAALRRTRDTADLVLCPSQATLEDCADAGIERGRLRHVPWGMDAEVASDQEVERARARHDLPDRYILFVGTLEPRKNLPRLLEAVRRLPPDEAAVLAVAGPVGWGDVHSLLDDQVKQRPLASDAERDRVRLLGFVPPSELAPLNRGAAVVCYPSLWEGYGLPVAEALAQGTPVVTSRGTATEELVEGGAGLVVDPRDPDEIAATLASVLSDSQLAARLSTAARARAGERTWAATAQLTVEAYQTVLRRERAGS